MESRYEQGMRVRTEVLGAEHVERARARTTELDEDKADELRGLESRGAHLEHRYRAS